MFSRILQSFSKYFLILIFASSVGLAFAEENNEGKKEEKHAGHEGGFNAGELIMHHIGDAHDWHIIDIGGHAISLPLPVIVCSFERGMDIFMSYHFHHGEFPSRYAIYFKRIFIQNLIIKTSNGE